MVRRLCGISKSKRWRVRRIAQRVLNASATLGKSGRFAMKILVTGGTGNVGSEVIKQLVKRSASVRALVRKQEATAKMPACFGKLLLV
jgi:Predicted nucleoside-diphosphate-sugar epimerases